MSSPAMKPYPPPPQPEALLPIQLTLLGTIVLQGVFAHRLIFGPRWLLPGIEGGLLCILIVLTPSTIKTEDEHRRRHALAVIALLSGVNIYSLYSLGHHLLKGSVTNGHELILSGMVIWLTNVIIFGVWYWETDRGGPGRRALGQDNYPSFLFPQMTDDAIHPPNWRPEFIDYLYVSLTNAAAFSPTDTMPLARGAKCAMGVQSLVSLVTLGLIVSRAVNILPQ
jgi:uncharacterized membrane protein